MLGLYYGNHKSSSLATITVLGYSFTGFFNGFYATKYFRYMGGKNWVINLTVSICIFPVIMFKF